MDDLALLTEEQVVASADPQVVRATIWALVQHVKDSFPRGRVRQWQYCEAVQCIHGTCGERMCRGCVNWEQFPMG